MVELRQTDAFAKWMLALRDRRGKARIQARLDRLVLGLPWDMKPVGGGVSEMRVPVGPGYRIYYVQRGLTVIVLLCGGDKSSQRRDILAAKAMVRQLGEQHDG